MTITIIAIPLGLLAGIIFAFEVKSQTDQTKKRNKKYWMTVSFLAPILSLIVLIIIYGITRLLFNTFK